MPYDSRQYHVETAAFWGVSMVHCQGGWDQPAKVVVSAGPLTAYLEEIRSVPLLRDEKTAAGVTNFGEGRAKILSTAEAPVLCAPC
jgi:hypothetical protein